MLANRVTMGPGIEPPQFQWVPYADALIFPLDNTGMVPHRPTESNSSHWKTRSGPAI